MKKVVVNYVTAVSRHDAKIQRERKNLASTVVTHLSTEYMAGFVIWPTGM
jgi:hypothetical protein